MASKIPGSFKRWIAMQLTQKFREAVELQTVPVPSLGPKQILIQNRYLGVNASDINLSAGRYDPSHKPPLPVGMEGLGTVVAAGSDCKHTPGQAVAYQAMGAYGEYMVLEDRHAFQVPAVKPDYITIPVSALTAALALDQVGEIKEGETVLVTAAAGGTGQFAVQLAKKAGCHVIGTCSSDEKVKFLKNLGCDRAINYKKENLNKVLKENYPKGIDVVYETIGGDVFDICVNRLAQKGRLIVIGFITGYETSIGYSQPNQLFGLPAKLLNKSASVRGFMMFHYAHLYKEYVPRLVSWIQDGTLKAITDNGERYEKGPFKGIDTVIDAVEYLYTKKNQGKIVVELPESHSSKL